MPIYEFYCPECHMIFSFLSVRVETNRVPRCPRCKSSSLTRRISKAAIISGKSRDDTDLPEDLPIDEKRLEEALYSLAGEAEKIDENDPRQIVRLMRKLSDQTGLQYSDTIEEALSRLEAGEDPEVLEQEFGDTLDDEEMPFKIKPSRLLSRLQKPKIDENLYDFDQYCD